MLPNSQRNEVETKTEFTRDYILGTIPPDQRSNQEGVHTLESLIKGRQKTDSFEGASGSFGDECIVSYLFVARANPLNASRPNLKNIIPAM